MSALVTEFTATFNAILSFLTGNWLTATILGCILVLGVGGAIISFIKSR